MKQEKDKLSSKPNGVERKALAKVKPIHYDLGRPTPYDPKFCDLLIQHLKLGYSFESFGGNPQVMVCGSTLDNWAKTYPEFFAAKMLGKVCSLYKWEDMGIRGLTDPVFNTSLYKFLVKNLHKANFREDPDADGIGNQSVQIIYKTKTND